jgi:hypothetical protein
VETVQQINAYMGFPAFAEQRYHAHDDYATPRRLWACDFGVSNRPPLRVA